MGFGECQAPLRVVPVLLPGTRYMISYAQNSTLYSIPYYIQGLSWANAGGPGRGWAGPGRPIILLYDGLHRGPAQPVKIFRGWAAARPGPSIFQTMGRGPAQPILKHLRPGPAHHMAARPMKHGLYMGRPMCYSVPKRACIHYADVKFKR